MEHATQHAEVRTDGEWTLDGGFTSTAEKDPSVAATQRQTVAGRFEWRRVRYSGQRFLIGFHGRAEFQKPQKTKQEERTMKSTTREERNMVDSYTNRSEVRPHGIGVLTLVSAGLFGRRERAAVARAQGGLSRHEPPRPSPEWRTAA